MNKILIVSSLILLSGVVFYILSKDATEAKQTAESVQPVKSADPQAPSASLSRAIKLLSSSEFEDKYKLKEDEKKFLSNFAKTEADLVIAQAVLLSLHDPKSPLV